MSSASLKIEGPRNPEPKEYASLLYFLNQSYDFSDMRWFENDTSFFYGTKPEQLKNKWLLKCGETFASHVGVFPFVAKVNGQSLKVAGIGSVATHPEYRNRGLMRKLMAHVGKQLVTEGYDLSILWGERALYEHFDYERGVFQDRFSFNRRFFKPLPLGKSIRPLKPTDWEDLKKLFCHHEFHTERIVDYFKTLHRRFNRGIPEPIWVMEKAGKIIAYVIVFKINEGYEVAEWGGEVKNVTDLIASVLPKPSTGNVWISIYPGCELYHWALENHESQIRTPNTCMVKILNLGKVLKAFESQLQERYESHALRNFGSLSLHLPGQKKVTLTFGNELKVETGETKGKAITLTQSQCVRLLFGGTWPSYELKLKDFELELLDSLFPLEWYWWRSDWI
jgi:predicted acetyltransferase